ncbi:hypothetical protein LZ575_11930 [Antarcticibacterium sp. 1MA-6-2]|uniref:hypothetical protein n=1 Tax=Antarcticibacterium sp. 1MA-6-2 TaxID=2908210 RepID=UPI001F292DFC|nr:hypothetical protein [Antarcticibacterium sp. 1MA-6-2]UJH89756.1 hypothetical protein LZ575_11930 [Antarcticibacterium sp. 1MA-6-2]
MKNKVYKLFMIASVFAMFACDSEQAGQDVSELGSTDTYPTPTFSFDSPTTINEGDETVLTYTVTFDKPIGRPVDFVLVQTGGDATLHEDFDFVNASVPAYGTTANLQVIVYNDDIFEGSESLTFEVQRGNSLANKYLIHPETVFPEPITVTIENSVSDDLKVILEWSGSYVGTDGVEHALCDLDLDLEIYDSALETVLANSYSSCPESISISPGDLEDGVYWIVPSFYSYAGTVAPAENFDIPAMLKFTQAGAEEVVTEDISNLWDYETGGAAEEAEDAYLVEYQLTVSGSSFTITNSEGTVVFEQ